jgi:hypothetical protein
MSTPAQLPLDLRGLISVPTGDFIKPLSKAGIPESIRAESIQILRANITSAQLKALKATPQVLLPAPGAGLAYVVEEVSLRCNYIATAYTLNAGTLIIYQGPVANAIPLTADMSAVLTPAAVTDIVGQPTISPGAKSQAQSENVAITIANAGAAEFTLGDGSLNVILTYGVVQM